MFKMIVQVLHNGWRNNERNISQRNETQFSESCQRKVLLSFWPNSFLFPIVIMVIFFPKIHLSALHDINSWNTIDTFHFFRKYTIFNIFIQKFPISLTPTNFSDSSCPILTNCGSAARCYNSTSTPTTTRASGASRASTCPHPTNRSPPPYPNLQPYTSRETRKLTDWNGNINSWAAGEGLVFG